MGRVTERWFDHKFALLRDPLVAIARQHSSTEGRQLEAAGSWLDTEYTEPKARKALERQRRLRRQQDLGSMPLGGRRGPSGCQTSLPGDGLRADRLERAFLTLCVQNKGGGLLRLLGPNLPQGERETNATRAVLVSACIVDPDAPAWLAWATELATTPWQGDASAAPPIKGRVDVAESWGYDALSLLGEGCTVLGWRPASDPDVDDPRRTTTDADSKEGDAIPDHLVTLDQAAAMVGRKKRTLERYVHDEKLPRPDFKGGGGKANRWRWSTIRPALQEHFRPDLPVKFPASRII